MPRRHFIFLVLAVLLAGLTGSASAQLVPRPIPQELKFGFTPVLSESEMRAEFEPLMNYLSEAIGRKVTLYIAKDYGDLRTQMENGSVDMVTSDLIPHDAIAVRIGLDEKLAKRIQTALVNLDKTEAGRRVISNSKKKLTGHVIAQDSVFDVVRRTAKIAGK